MKENRRCLISSGTPEGLTRVGSVVLVFVDVGIFYRTRDKTSQHRVSVWWMGVPTHAITK